MAPTRLPIIFATWVDACPKIVPSSKQDDIDVMSVKREHRAMCTRESQQKLKKNLKKNICFE